MRPICPVRAVLEGWGYGAALDWASLARIDAALGRSRVTDAWYPEAARLRAEWRMNVTVDPDRNAFDALQLLERALPLAPNRDLHRLRAAAALALGDHDRVLESARYVSTHIRSNLAAAPDQSSRVPTQELARMRRNLVAIADRLRGGLEVRDPQRVRLVLDGVSELLEQIDGYPSPPAVQRDPPTFNRDIAPIRP